MDASSAARRPKVARLDKDQDLTVLGNSRLCSLPDAIRLRILFFLPMNDAVRTSLLSKDWVYLWTLLPDLRFNVTEIVESSLFQLQNSQLTRRKISRRIIKSMERAFVLRDPQYTLKTFTLEDFILTDKASCRRISACLQAAIKCKIQELSMAFDHCRELSEVSNLIFRSQTLVKLDLRFLASGTLRIPSAVQLPNLKVLRLAAVKFADSASAEKLFSCPLLEVLFIRITYRANITTLRISAPKLRDLTIIEESYWCGTQVSIDGTNLESFRYDGYLRNKCVLTSTDKLVEVGIFIIDDHEKDHVADHVFQLLRSVSSVKNLTLHCSKAILFDDDNSYKLQYLLPVFHNLIHLNLKINCKIGEGFLTVLKKFPHLRILKLDSHEVSQWPDGYHDEGEGDELEDVPSCFLTHLKRIIVMEFNSTNEHFNIVRVLLRNAVALEEMIITSIRYLPSFHVEKLASLPRGSRNCTLSIKYPAP